MNKDPIAHHYLAKFYLSRWSNSLHDNNLYCYSKPYNNLLKGKWVSSTQTGFAPHLYSFKDGRTGQPINLELQLLQTVDDSAAKVLAVIEQGSLPKTGTDDRTNWAKFIICQLMRTPEDLAQLRVMASEQWANEAPQLQAAYDKWRQGQGPENILDFLKQNFPELDSEFAARLATSLLIHKDITNLLASMRWRIISFSEDCHPLLTSDRPVWVSATLKDRDDFLWMPIGPRKLFVAAIDDVVLNIMADRPQREFAKAINEIIAKTAIRFVYSKNDDSKTFIEKRFGIAPHSRLLELVARQRGLTILDKNSPSY